MDNRNQIRSSRRLEVECRRNVELMWLLGRLYPDHKSIAEFRRMHRDAVTAAGSELVRFARGCGLIRGEWIAIDGTRFRAVASIDSTRERLALQRYLDSMEKQMKNNRRVSIRLLCRRPWRSCRIILTLRRVSWWCVRPLYRRTTSRLLSTLSML